MPGVRRISFFPPDASFVIDDDVDQLISGAPSQRDAGEDLSADGRARCGVWTCGSYKEHVGSFPTNELFMVIEGTVVVTVDGAEPESFSAGEALGIEQGTACTLEFYGPFRKLYMTYEQELPG